jgi:phosphopantothenoylcysteine decarboxylase/phosphopantothenate--cysteine ligase
MRILITSGGTQVPIDGVRFIHNMSTGRFGAQLSREFLERGHSVRLIHAKNAETTFSVNVNLDRENLNQTMRRVFYLDELHVKVKEKYFEVQFKTYDDYVRVLKEEIEFFQPDIIILSAAVSDYGVNTVEGKMDSTAEITLKLHKLEKVIDKIRTWAPLAYVVGFKLLVNSTPTEMKKAAEKQLERADVDMVVGNDLAQIRKGNHFLTVFYGNNDQWRINENQASELAKMIEQRPKSVSDFTS